MKSNNMFYQTTKWIKFLVPAFALLVFMGCGDDEEPGDGGNGDSPVASFQFEVDAVEFLKVSFTNFSANSTEYSWDFGDGESSTEENPVHTYAAGGEYTVTLTARDGSGAASEQSKSFTLTDPNEQLALLAGTESKTWYLLREGIALGIGPALNDNAWWSFGGVTPLGDRPCILDDSYTFYRDGRYEANTKGTVFIDAAVNGGWKENEGCFDESDGDVWTHFQTGEDVSGFANGGDYSYTYESSTGVLTTTGLGNYIGLPVKTNAGDNYVPIQSKTYNVFNLADGDVADTLHMALQGDGFSWNFYLVSYENESDLPPLPSSEPRAQFDVNKDGLTVEFVNQSANATSYMWDFGDGGMSTEDNPTHTYGASGDYEVTLTATDANMVSDMTTMTVSVSDALFSAEALSNADGKVWRLAGAGSYKVGSFPNGGDFWGGLDEAGAMERACQMDDEFILTDGGAFKIDVKEDVWAEDYMGGAFACTPVGDLVSPFDVFAGGDFTFEALEASGDNLGQIRVVGTGAYLGFNKPFNQGELTNDGLGTPASEITYDVIGYTSTAEKDEIVLTIAYTPDGCCYWTITLESIN